MSTSDKPERERRPRHRAPTHRRKGDPDQPPERSGKVGHRAAIRLKELRTRHNRETN